MSKNSQQNPTVVAPASDEERFQQLLKDAGFVKREKPVELSPEAKVERLQQLENLLIQAKLVKDEKAGKKIRRQMRALGFKRSVWLRNLKAEFNQ